PPERSPTPRSLSEALMRPGRLTQQGRGEYERGNDPQARGAFEEATRPRPADQAARFNLADALYKNGKYDEAAVLYDALGKDPRAPLAAPSRFNLGNARYQKQDYKGAVDAYKGALDLRPDDPDVRRNLELALRAIKKQQEEQQRQQQQKQDDKKDQKQGQDQKPNPQKDQKDPKGEPKKDGKPERPKTPEEKEEERFQQETGMPKDRAMQLLDALQQGGKAEQKRLLAARRDAKKTKKDW